MRKNIIIANWKMNKKYNDIANYFSEFNTLYKKDKVINKSKNIEIIFAPGYMALLPSLSITKNKLTIAAQELNSESNGAFTGQVSYSQVKEYNVNHSLVGHSETREYLRVTDVQVNKKIIALINAEMKSILCVGETQEQYKAKKTIDVLTKQLTTAFKDIPAEKTSEVIIAYEPVWSIGTGILPVSKDIQKTIAAIRTIIKKLYSAEIAEKIHVLYGGSVKLENSKEILQLEGVDGLLIGGASLVAKDFFEIIKNTPHYIKENEEFNKLSYFKKMFYSPKNEQSKNPKEDKTEQKQEVVKKQEQQGSK